MRIDTDEATVSGLVADLSGLKFVPYLTAVGGSGLGILPPNRYSKGSVIGSAELESFVGSQPAELAKWADERGRWLYV